MAIPGNDKEVGDAGHVDDHNAIADELTSHDTRITSAQTAADDAVTTAAADATAKVAAEEARADAAYAPIDIGLGDLADVDLSAASNDYVLATNDGTDWLAIPKPLDGVEGPPGADGAAGAAGTGLEMVFYDEGLASWPERGVSALPVVFYSRLNPEAASPLDMVEGDLWWGAY